MVRTFARRLKGDGGLARLYQPAFAAAYLMDQLYDTVVSDTHVDVPTISDEHETMARELVRRSGGATAAASAMHF